MRAELAEAIGTFALVFVGCGAIVADASGAALGLVGVALAFTFVVASMVYAIGHVSGAHINPAITVGFALTGRFPWRRVPSYAAAQCLGALAAGSLLLGLFGGVGDLGATSLAGDVVLWKGFLLEVVATAFLAFVIASVATDARAHGASAGLAIGIAVGMGALVAGSLTGGSMNPARSLGPALVAGELGHLWLYLVAPVIGSSIAMAAYELIRAGEVPSPSDQPAPVTEDVAPAEVG